MEHLGKEDRSVCLVLSDQLERRVKPVLGAKLVRQGLLELLDCEV